MTRNEHDHDQDDRDCDQDERHGRELIRLALDAASNPGHTARDEALLALIEALLRDVLGQQHGVWNWRVPAKHSALQGERSRKFNCPPSLRQREVTGAE